MGMNDFVIRPDDERQKTTNRNLAIAIGIGGFGLFVLFYILFFAVMITRPGLMFKLMPVPSFTDAALSDGKWTYLLSRKIDMSNVDPRQNRQPRIRHFLSILSGTEPGPEQEIPSYTQAFGANDRLVFLYDGGYRMYDGSRWTEEPSEAVGKDPQGLSTPDGLYVLSERDSAPRLSLITRGAAVDLPLPHEFLTANKQERCTCSKLARYQGRLCLFWTAGGSIAWSVLNGTAWTHAASSPFSGGYDIVSDEDHLYFFHREGDGPGRSLSYTVFANDAWAAPIRLPVQGGFVKWNAFLQQGKLKLFVEQITSQTLYTIEKGSLADPLLLKGPFNPARMSALMVLPAVLINVFSFLALFGVSALIRKYKKRIWKANTVEHEFASLFRRFLAMLIDNMVLLVPSAAVIVLTMPRPENLSRNPFQFLIMMLSMLAFFFIGGFLYQSLLEGLLGKTLGKKICGIRVVKADFSPCGLTAGFLRNIMRIVDAFFYYLAAVISLAATVKWQRLGDLVADTVVVKDSKRAARSSAAEVSETAPLP